MNSRVSWDNDGIDPSVRERAEAAARRAGMSLNDWLTSTVGASTPPAFRAPTDRPAQASRGSRDVADIHQRLDAITQHIEQIARPAPRPDAFREQGAARHLNDAISRLDARLAQISNPQPRQDTDEMRDAVERAAAQLYRNAPPLSPASLDVAVAEISARQSELDGHAPRPARPRNPTPAAPSARPQAPVVAPAAPVASGPDFSRLERHLLNITSQIEALQRPDHVEQSIEAFRHELADIRTALTAAMPRQAIESIENEVRSLHRRIDENRNSSPDASRLTGIERALSEIREVLRSLTPAEQLTGYDEAIHNLGAKLDSILRANDDPRTVEQLEGAIAALRGIVSNVASNDALARLSEDVALLGAKVDQITRSSGAESFSVLEERLATLTATIEHRERAPASQGIEHIEEAIRGLSERLDRMEVGRDGASTVAHLEQRVTYLLERLDAASDPHNARLNRVEDGLQDVLRHLERQQATYAALAESRRVSDTSDPGVMDLVKRELADIRFSQSETNRSTQDSLEAVNSTLGHVVDRLATIEGDLRAVRAAPTPAPVASRPAPPPLESKPELPNPAAAQATFTAAPRDFHGAEGPPRPPILPPRAISEILEPHAAAAPRAAITPDLPPDHPLEPGTRPNARTASPSERIAASESAISDIPAAPSEPVSSSSFIAAARRAAQAAAAAQPEKPGRGSIIGKDKAARDTISGGSTVASKMRSLLVGASVVVIVLGTFRMAMNLLDSASTPPLAVDSISEPAPRAQSPAPAPAEISPKPGASEQVTPSMTSPMPIGRQSLNKAGPSTDAVASLDNAAAAPSSASDVTGGVATGPRRYAMVQVPPSERIPDAIGGAGLRNAAMKGDAAAAYELALRFADGKGVPASYDEAAKWYDRAAQAGVVPATFRLGTLYEKGLGVKKDADIARRYYTQAAERGNAKAMHNLAVLDADGGGRGANYKSAAQWFRKAADRGVADSQYNLAILYARGIGVEQNLPESYKWFSLAAAQGDADAASKREDIAKHLDAQSLAAAKLAIQTFAAEPQPDETVNVAAPAGGWDAVTAQTNAGKPGKSGPMKRASR